MTNRLRDSEGTAKELVVALEGEYDLARRDALAAQLCDAAEAVQPGDVFVLDLRRVTFADSSALSCFVQLQRVLATRRGRLLTLCDEGTLVRRAIAITQLEDTLNVSSS